ncbi:MAG TPA: ATP-binding protein [Solirubrobacteraceae bacterium]|nr:ATP-binding protein [Solirubrobacteraceae bacterium]
MSTSPVAVDRGPRYADPLWKATAVAGTAQLAGLAIALSGSSHAVLAVSVAVAGVVIAAFVLAPQAAAAVHRHPALLLVAAAVLFCVLWVVVGLMGLGIDHVSALPGMHVLWSLARTGGLSLVLMSLAAVGGVVLIADALRVRLGLARRRSAPWQQMTATGSSGPLVPWRAVAGVLLVGWSAVLAIGLAGPYAGSSALAQLLLLVLVAGAAAVVIGTPLLIASLTRVDREQTQDAHEEVRQRFAAHLHDSVLQTLALVQRQAHDPTAVARLARRQEHALRAWMAGESELVSDTLVAALRDAVAEVEDEEAITVELTAIGDRPIDLAGEALVAAAREALRNAARHAGSAPVVVFAELTAAGVEVFVRDDGAGFDPESVPAGRRGIRDAIIGRMAAAGGSATVESAPGEGTEVALRLGPAVAPGTSR